MKARRASRGYTFIELLMALALFAIAVMGIIALQKITIVSNTHAKNMAVAQRIAQAWAGQLEMDATEWSTNFGSGFLNGNGTWARPGYIASRNFGAAFDALGNPVPDNELGRARFCSHVRMSWLYPTTMGVGGNGLLRAEIRVFWLREGMQPLDTTVTMCSATQTAVQARNIGLATDLYHFVYQTVGVKQHFRI
jgi:prepilin-type N-terminal cleavage/methylation domain-containing protein